MNRISSTLLVVAALALALATLVTPKNPAPEQPSLVARRAHVPRLLQDGLPDDLGWKPQEPFDLGSTMPKDEEVGAAITRGIEYLLERQTTEGAWDERLTGSMLSVVAEHALDSVSLTALCGMALRAQAAYDKRVEAALDKAVSYILSQVFRGKLPLKVYYSNWRYTYGLQFLVGEFRASANEGRKLEIKACARRMVNALLKMQLSNGEARLLDKANAARVELREKFKRLPGQLGLALAEPSDGDYRGGARVLDVIKGSAAEKAGVRVGDRVIQCEGLWIENALDYYTLEQEFLRGQTVSLKVKRTPQVLALSCKIEDPWPAYLGIEVGGGKGADTEVVQFLGLSPAETAGMKVGDVVTALNGEKVKDRADYYAKLTKFEEGANVSVTFERDGKSQSLEMKATRAPEADLGIYLAEEDSSGEEGILVGDSIIRPQPGPIVPGPGGAALGMKPGDRICKVNGIPVFAIDLFAGVSAANPAGLPVSVEWLHGATRMTGSLVPRASKQPGSLGVVLDVAGPMDPPVVKSVMPDSAAALGGIAPGDTIMSINGIGVPTHVFYTRVMARFYAGEEVRVTVLRSVKVLPPGRFRLDKATATPPDEEGGWSYYPDVGEAMSFSTAAALLALYDGASVLGLAAPAQALKAAENFVDSLRAADASHAGAASYYYWRSAMKQEFGGGGADVRGTLGRIGICELALLLAKRRKPADVEKSLLTWLEFRGELDRVRSYPYTHLPQLYNNAAYYWLFGHWYAMKAAREIGGKCCEKVNEAVVKALMLKREKDGTWLHHESFGKVCGTAMALLALGETQGGWKK